MKEKLVNVGLSILAAFFGGLALAIVAAFAALAVAIAKNANTWADIPHIVTQIGSNANLALDLLQELLQEIPLGTQMSYLLDSLLQKKIINPFHWIGFREIFIEGLAVAALTNLLSVVISPQRGISSALHAIGFEYVVALMHLINNSLAMIVVIVLQRVLFNPIWIIAFALVALLLETVLLFGRIKVFSLGRIACHVVKHDLAGFLLKQAVMCLFLSTIIHMLDTGMPTDVWEYILCILVVVATTPFLEWIDQWLGV